MKIFKNIKQLAQIRSVNESIVKGAKMNELPTLENAWLRIENDRIQDFGSMAQFDELNTTGYEIVDVTGQCILPTWVDSHTHLVYANTREQEFVDRINGLTYEQIAQRGGGILNSAAMLANASEDDLFWTAFERLNKVIKLGTGAIEIKSGYGLTLETELKMLRVIKRLQGVSPIPVKATFLGAHAFPAHLKETPNVYIHQIINEMIPAVAEEQLAEYIDVFCEKGYFDTDQTKRILEAGIKHGLKPKVHVNQFNIINGIETSVKANAISVDHLEVLSEKDIEVLSKSNTMPVALPSCSFFLQIPYTPARQIINAGLPLALATDYNPGSTPSGNMNFVVSLACIQMKMTPEEAVNAATVNAAAAIELSSSLGSITPGKKANFILTEKISSLHYLPYSFGENCISSVYINGEIFN
ncbi:MAG: imidazolonepropionase [Salibacteraceae bacterium]|nr:imidazolonepropionase [Salibacteraceae bacterium]